MSFHVEFHPSGLPRIGQKVCGGGWWVGGGGWQGLKSSFASWEQRGEFGLLPANIYTQTIEYYNFTLFQFLMWSTFLGRGTLPGSSAPVLPILFRPWFHPTKTLKLRIED